MVLDHLLVYLGYLCPSATIEEFPQNYSGQYGREKVELSL